MTQREEMVELRTVNPCEEREERKKSGELELSPEEAIRAMLDGETLVGRDGSFSVRWNYASAKFEYVENSYSVIFFNGLCLQPQKKTRPMDTFECLAWVNSPDSLGWMVSFKHRFDEGWSDWDIPQRLRYTRKIANKQATEALAVEEVNKSGIAA